MAVAVYSGDVEYSLLCPRSLEFDSPAHGFRCSVALPEDGPGIEISIDAPSASDEWVGGEAVLEAADDEANRIVAALCFRYMAPFRPVRRISPPVPVYSVYFDVQGLTFSDAWPGELRQLAVELPTLDPRAYPLWMTLASVGSLTDRLSRFVALWGLLDIGLAADAPWQIDDYLVDRFGVTRDCPDRNGTANRETKFTYLRHRIAHPAGRSVQSVAALASDAGAMLEELAEYCRIAVSEDFGRS